MAATVPPAPTTTTTTSVPPGSVDISTLPTPQLSVLQQRLSAEFSHLSASYTRLRAAQGRFRDCIVAVQESGLTGTTGTADKEKEVLVPLTASLYVPGRLSVGKVLVDVGTGFYVEKSGEQAVKFYEGKVAELGQRLGELEGLVRGKGEGLSVVEGMLRGKVLAEQQGGGKGEDETEGAG